MGRRRQEMKVNVTMCEGSGGHYWWGGHGKYSDAHRRFEETQPESFEMIKAMLIDNQFFDVTEQIVNFIGMRTRLRPANQSWEVRGGEAEPERGSRGKENWGPND